MSKESETRQSYKICSSRPIAMLDIRATGRDAVALPYSYLEMVQFNPSEAIVLTFATCEVRVEGHCLPALYDALVQHSVEYIVSGHSKPATKGRMKTSHFEGSIAYLAAWAALGRDERTQRELAAFDINSSGQRLVQPADCA